MLIKIKTFSETMKRESLSEMTSSKEIFPGFQNSLAHLLFVPPFCPSPAQGIDQQMREGVDDCLSLGHLASTVTVSQRTSRTIEGLKTMTVGSMNAPVSAIALETSID